MLSAVADPAATYSSSPFSPGIPLSYFRRPPGAPVQSRLSSSPGKPQAPLQEAPLVSEWLVATLESPETWKSSYSLLASTEPALPDATGSARPPFTFFPLPRYSSGGLNTFGV